MFAISKINQTGNETKRKFKNSLKLTHLVHRTLFFIYLLSSCCHTSGKNEKLASSILCGKINLRQSNCQKT